jgi:hypothetical protein
MSAVATDITRQFLGALNGRDLGALRALVTPDVVFPNRQGRTLRGVTGLEAVVTAAEDVNLRIEPAGDTTLREDGRVLLPVRVVTGTDAVRGIAQFVIRDGKVAMFDVVPDE